MGVVDPDSDRPPIVAAATPQSGGGSLSGLINYCLSDTIFFNEFAFGITVYTNSPLDLAYSGYPHPTFRSRLRKRFWC